MGIFRFFNAIFLVVAFVVTGSAYAQKAAQCSKEKKQFQIKCKSAESLGEISIERIGSKTDTAGNGTLLSFVMFMQWVTYNKDSIVNDKMKFNRMVDLGRAITDSLKYKMGLKSLPGKDGKGKALSTRWDGKKGSKDKDFKCPKKDHKGEMKMDGASVKSLIKGISCFFPRSKRHKTGKDFDKKAKEKFIKNMGRLKELVGKINKELCNTKDIGSTKVSIKVKSGGSKDVDLANNGSEHTCKLTIGDPKKPNIGSKVNLAGCTGNEISFIGLTGDKTGGIKELCKQSSGGQEGRTRRERQAPDKAGTYGKGRR